MRFENKDDGYAPPRRPAFTPPSRVDLRDQKFESGPPPAESPLRTQKAGVLHSDFCEFIALGSVGPRLTFLRVHGDQPLQSPSLHPVLSAWLGMIGNMAMGRWAVARRTRTATPTLKRSSDATQRPFPTASLRTQQGGALTPDGLTPFFQEYELAGYAFGQPEVTVPWTDIRDLLQPDLDLRPKGAGN